MDKKCNIVKWTIIICILMICTTVFIGYNNSKNRKSNFNNNTSNTYTNYSTSNKLDYCIAYGCARKEAYSGAKYCTEHLLDKYNDNSSNKYSNYHKCEYYGCDNYASGTKYCSKHNQTKCSKIGCNNKEAYQGAGYCTEHLLEIIEKYN